MITNDQPHTRKGPIHVLSDGTELDLSEPPRCKVCRRGIFSHQSRTWRDSPMGLSHTACVKEDNRDTQA